MKHCQRKLFLFTRASKCKIAVKTSTIKMIFLKRYLLHAKSIMQLNGKLIGNMESAQNVLNMNLWIACQMTI